MLATINGTTWYYFKARILPPHANLRTASQPFAINVKLRKLFGVAELGAIQGSCSCWSTEPKVRGSNPLGCTSESLAVQGFLSLERQASSNTQNSISQDFTEILPFSLLRQTTQLSVIGSTLAFVERTHSFDEIRHVALGKADADGKHELR